MTISVRTSQNIWTVALVCVLFASLPPSKVSAQDAASQTLGLKLPARPIYSNRPDYSLTMQGYYPGQVSPFHSNRRYEFEIESLDAPVVLRTTVLKEDIRPPLVLSLSEYNNMMILNEERGIWREFIVREISAYATRDKGRGGLNLDIPVKIKSKTFQAIFGSGNVGLTVTGDIRIQAGLRREDRSEVRTALTRGANTNFKMEQTQRFTVKGNIGDKVTVNVDQDSERAFDFDNNVRLVLPHTKKIF